MSLESVYILCPTFSPKSSYFNGTTVMFKEKRVLSWVYSMNTYTKKEVSVWVSVMLDEKTVLTEFLWCM